MLMLTAEVNEAEDPETWRVAVEAADARDFVASGCGCWTGGSGGQVDLTVVEVEGLTGGCSYV